MIAFNQVRISHLPILEEKTSRLIGILEIVELELQGEALDALVARTHVVINGVGPYHRYSTPVLVACANAGTHYVDL